MKLRRLTLEGIQTFRQYLAQSRMNSDHESPKGLLESRLLTEVIEPGIQVAPSHFYTKGEAGRYLTTILSSLLSEDIAQDAGLWSWLSLLYFESVCPLHEDGRIVRNDYYFVFEPNNVRNFYRHLLFVSWRIIQLAPTHNRLFSSTPVSVLDGMTTEVMKRLFLTRIPCMFEVLDRLYWDESKKRARPGLTGSKTHPGDLRHRLPIRIRQLEKTYDLMSLTADQLLELLGEEFSFARPPSKTLFSESIVH